MKYILTTIITVAIIFSHVVTIDAATYGRSIIATSTTPSAPIFPSYQWSGAPIWANNFKATSTTATSTFAGGIQTNLLNVTSTTASSSFANGINLTAGCFSINGVCAGSGAGTVDGTGFAGMMASWVDANTVRATSTIVGSHFIATSSTETNIFKGIFKVENISYLSRVFIDTEDSNTAAKFGIEDPSDSGVTAVFQGANTDGIALSLSSTGAKDYRLISGTDSTFAIRDISAGVDRIKIGSTGNIGLGTTTPGTELSIGNTGNDTINISATATSTFGSGINLRSGCFAVNGVCVGGGAGTYGDSDVNTYIHASTTIPKTYTTNTFTALQTFTGGLISSASTTIGSGTRAGGLTISGGATTTGIAYFASNLGIGTTSPYAKLSVVGEVVAPYYTATSTTAVSKFVKTTFGDTSVADGTVWNVTYTTDPINGGFSAMNVDPSAANHQIYWGRLVTPFNNTFYNNNAFIVNSLATDGTGGIVLSQDGATWRIYADNSTNFSIGTGGTDIFWSGNYAPSGSIPANLFSIVPSSASVGGITLAPRAITSQTGDLQQWQDVSGNALAKLTVGGNFGIGTTTPYAKLSVVGEAVARNFTATSTAATSTFQGGFVHTKSYTPASASATCTTGEHTWDATYFYICIAANTWERSLHDTW